jgi:hypothetical protein
MPYIIQICLLALNWEAPYLSVDKSDGSCGGAMHRYCSVVSPAIALRDLQSIALHIDIVRCVKPVRQVRPCKHDELLSASSCPSLMLVLCILLTVHVSTVAHLHASSQCPKPARSNLEVQIPLLHYSHGQHVDAGVLRL